MDDEKNPRRFYAVRLEDDIPQSGLGLLIPGARKSKKTIGATPTPKNYSQYTTLLLLPLLAAAFAGVTSLIGLQSLATTNTAQLPQRQPVIAPIEQGPSLNYGVQIALSQPGYFAETRDAFIDAEATFIEIDQSAMLLRYFEKGVLTLSQPILAKGEVGSWWQTPAGLYLVEAMKEKQFSAVGQMYQPWSITFQGNFVIHGWPELEDGSRVPPDFTAGGIRLDTADAAVLYEKVALGIPVLVHQLDVPEEVFVYEPKIPELKTPHYLIADVKSSTVLASSDTDTVAPIASVTKLMTALVAAEHINLDSSVYVDEPTFVQSLIPRLGDRSKVSMYSLLQLLLVESSNEAAEVIASQLGREVFITKMNQKARTLGMVNTHFSDPAGLSAENTSSLSDLLRLAQYIYTNRSFVFELTANQDLKTAHVGGDFGELVNFNKVEGLENFIGGKVGETIAAGQTSVTLHTLEVKGETRVLAIIILGSENRTEDVRQLLQYAEERFGN